MILEKTDNFYRSVFEYSMDAVFLTAPDGRIFAANPAACKLFGRTEKEICQAGRSGLVDRESPLLVDLIEERKRTGNMRGELIYIRGDGSRFPGEVCSQVFTDADGEVRTILIVRDLSEAKQSEQIREKLLDQVTQEVAEVEAILASQDDVILLYDKEMNVRRANPSFSIYFGFDPVGFNVTEIIKRVSCRRLDGQLLVISDQPTPRALRGEIIEKVPFIVTRADGSTAIVETTSRPVQVGGSIIGTVTLWQDITERMRQEHDLRELSLHLQNVREEEKASIAREVHDELSSALAAVKFDAYYLTKKLAEIDGMELLLERAKSLVKLSDNMTKASRRIITNLRPTILDEISLTAAVLWYCADFKKRTGIECEVDCAKEDSWERKMEKRLSINLFRILQEALTNVARHSEASEVKVGLKHINGAVILSVQDNGCGLPEGKSFSPTSHGIRGMQERMRLLGGKIRFHRPSEGGFCVTVETSLLPSQSGN